MVSVVSWWLAASSVVECISELFITTSSVHRLCVAEATEHHVTEGERRRTSRSENKTALYMHLA
jgi:hypothetical protein